MNGPYVPSRVVRDGALNSALMPSARVEGEKQGGVEGYDRGQ